MLSRPAPRCHGPPKYLEQICNLIEGQHPGTGDGRSARINAVVCEQISGWMLWWLRRLLDLHLMSVHTGLLPWDLAWNLARKVLEHRHRGECCPYSK